jgi:uncharacterized phage-like protein YoqJ
MKIAFTGPRPQNLPGYNFERLTNLAVATLRRTVEVYKVQPEDITAYSGCALGWDTACIHACQYLKLPYIACVPFQGQESRWHSTDRDLYLKNLTYSKEVVIVDTLSDYQITRYDIKGDRYLPVPPGEYNSRKLTQRNRYMVDQLTIGDVLIALLNPRNPSSGTKYCVDYAVSKGVKIINVWNSWEKYSVSN